MSAMCRGKCGPAQRAGPRHVLQSARVAIEDLACPAERAILNRRARRHRTVAPGEQHEQRPQARSRIVGYLRGAPEALAARPRAHARSSGSMPDGRRDPLTLETCRRSVLSRSRGPFTPWHAHRPRSSRAGVITASAGQHCQARLGGESARHPGHGRSVARLRARRTKIAAIERSAAT